MRGAFEAHPRYTMSRSKVQTNGLKAMLALILWQRNTHSAQGTVFDVIVSSHTLPAPRSPLSLEIIIYLRNDWFQMCNGRRTATAFWLLTHHRPLSVEYFRSVPSSASPPLWPKRTRSDASIHHIHVVPKANSSSGNFLSNRILYEQSIWPGNGWPCVGQFFAKINSCHKCAKEICFVSMRLPYGTQNWCVINSDFAIRHSDVVCVCVRCACEVVWTWHFRFEWERRTA